MATMKVPITGKRAWLVHHTSSKKCKTDLELFSEEDILVPGDGLGMNASEFLKGHGVYASKKGELVANVGGEIKRVDQVVSVAPLWARYIGDVGDVVVGRILMVGQKKWFVEINGLQDATLHLTSVNLPSGQQRRRTAEDELQMREIFEEGDLLVAEVQSVYHDGSIALHTRTTKFGRLRGGTLVQIFPGLVKRLEQHIIAIPELGVELVIGLNGYIWIAPINKSNKPSSREAVAKVRNAIMVLKTNQRTVCPASIKEMMALMKGSAKTVVVDPFHCGLPL
jgi:exosome complex component RRP4|eukprot:Stramenopile-MAST_4_protein_1198